MDEQNGSKLKTLDDLATAMVEGGGGRCERCRRESATIRLDAKLRGIREGKAGPSPILAKVNGVVCEQCGVEILAVVAKAVGRVR